MQRNLETFGHETLANVFNGLCATVERVGDLGIGPGRAIRIRLEQHVGPPHLSAPPPVAA
jgi:hypothetical protein